jgi:hypothetical protein
MPAASKAQQRFFGMVRATQKGEMKNPSSEILDVADDISVKDAKKMAKTKHKGLPEKVNEDLTSYKTFIKNAEDSRDKVKKKTDERKKKDAAYVDRVKKGIRFYDKKGKGHIRGGKKVYD